MTLLYKIATCFIVFFFLLTSENCFSQKSTERNIDECKSSIQKAYNQLKEFSVPTKDRGMYLSYTVNSFFGSPESPENIKEQVKVYLKGERSFLTSNAIDVYQDKNTMVSILKHKKAIYISAPETEERKQMQLENYIMFQDSMLSNATVQTCVPAGNGFQKIILVPEQKFKAATGIQHVEYLLNKEKIEIKKTVMIYKENQPLLKLSFEINEMDMAYSGEFYKGKAEGQVVNGAGILLKTYDSYQLIDLRKQP